MNSPTNKDVDFFKEHEEEGTKLSDWTSSVLTTTAAQQIPVSNGTLSKEQQLFGMHRLLASKRWKGASGKYDFASENRNGQRAC